ncbi:DUF4139 domain-containing protein [Lysobacter sp. M15]|uniref:DUF4139 domain-containing protein n=1 Tax=Lysobacter sp. M15 TaxID=2916837 RepID=UPI001F59A19F|nr:DUF4139 domain-containing protein [Lysobacter sp. M15]
MHRALPLLALACSMAGCTREQASPSAAPQSDRADPLPVAASRSPQAAQPGTHLTIYSGDYEQLAAGADFQGPAPGFVLVERALKYTLKSGVNRISATGVPRAMDAEAVTLRPLGAGIGILSQRYIAPPKGSRDVLAAAAGRRVTVEHTSGGAKQTDTGTLVSASDGLTLALNDGRIKVIREYDNFSLVEAEALIPQQAALQWTVQSAKSGEGRFELSYPMGGMAWRAEYLATLVPGGGCRLDLDGAALVANRSGVTFGDARLTLVAGQPAREQRQREEFGYDAAASAAPEMQQMAGNVPQERTSGEYHAYELPGGFEIANGSTERVPLFARLNDVACERAYETTPEIGLWEPPQPLIEPGFNNQTGPQPVKSTVSLNKDKASALDRALPGGRVRVFDGRDFLGESTLAHTPKGAQIRLEVGTAFDLTAERERTAFRVDRAGRTMTESFSITLKNAKPIATPVLVVEPIPRWSAWEIVDSSVPAKKRDAHRAEFEVTVPANGEARVTYTARYRWAPGIRP